MGMSSQAPPLARTDPRTAETLGRSDRLAWIGLIKSELGPGGCRTVACTAVAGIEARECRVTVRWDDSRSTGGSGQQEMTTVVRL